MKKIILTLLLLTFVIPNNLFTLNYVQSAYADSNKSEKNEIFESIEVFKLIEKYCDLYSVPKHIAYNIAYLETRYSGPFHFQYNPYVKSHSGALGVMQILQSTANYVNNQKITKHELVHNLELNISTSLKLLKSLYNKYSDWGKVCGCYNTGRPIINKYALFCIKNKDYTRRWLFPDLI